MNSSRPYLVRALYEWIVDNDCTPHILVNAEFAGVKVPPGYASDGQIVLNVSPSAVRHLHMDNEAVSFEGRFGGVAQSLYIPALAVMAIYARENGQGMVSIWSSRVRWTTSRAMTMADRPMSRRVPVAGHP